MAPQPSVCFNLDAVAQSVLSEKATQVRDPGHSSWVEIDPLHAQLGSQEQDEIDKVEIGNGIVHGSIEAECQAGCSSSRPDVPQKV